MDIVARRIAWPETAIAVVASVFYASTLSFGLVFDDHSLIDRFGPRLIGGPVPYRPLRFASLWLDARIGGGQPWAYHLGNVALHAAAAVMVVKLARRAGAASVVAFVCALPFVAHPLAVEAVAYVAGRRDLLATVCGLGAVLAWASFNSALAIVMVIAAVAAKEAGLLFVVVLLAASVCGIGLEPRRALSPLLYTALAGVTLAVVYGAQGPLAPHGALQAKLALAGALAWHYVVHVVAPFGLSIEYPELRCAPGACSGLAAWHVACGVGVLMIAAAASALALWRARGDWQRAQRARCEQEAVQVAQQDSSKHVRPARVDAQAMETARWRAFALSWLTIWLFALCFAIGGHEPGADRHAYPLLAALSVSLAAFGPRTAQPPRTVFVAVVLIWAVALVPITRGRIEVWRDDLSLWSAAVETSAASARVQHNLAAALAERRRFARAHRHLTRALTIDSSYWPSFIGFAGIDCERGRFAAARQRVDEARALGAGAADVSEVERRCADLDRRP